VAIWVDSKRTLRISQYVAKIWTTIIYTVYFSTHGVAHTAYLRSSIIIHALGTQHKPTIVPLYYTERERWHLQIAVLRNRRWCGSVYVLQMFFVFFSFFSVRKKYETTVLGNGWTDFHETFTKRCRGKWSFQRRVAAWRMANVDDLRNLRYDSGTITRGRHARRLRYKIMSARTDLI